MKLFKILNLGLLSTAYASENRLKDQMQVAEEVLSKVRNMETVIDLLRQLSLNASTLDDVSPREMIKKIVEITGSSFSERVYKYFAISPKEIKALSKYVKDADQQPTSRFGISGQAMSAFDPGNFIMGYGCWCRFGGASKGRGKAVDDVDNLCKRLTQSYECLRLDVLQQDGAYCDPITEPYNFDLGNYIMFSLNLPSQTISDNCQTQNPQRCAAQTCELELTMLTEYYRGLLKDPNFTELTVDQNYQHVKQGGPFDPAVDCGNPGNPGTLANQQLNAGNHAMSWTNDKECCGSFPHRVPFHTMGGQRACCNGRTYNTLMNNCCAGVVQISC